MALYTAQTLLVLEGLYGVDYVDRILDEGLSDMARKAKRALGTRAGAALATGALALGSAGAIGGGTAISYKRHKDQQADNRRAQEIQKSGRAALKRDKRAGQQRLRDLGYVVDAPRR